MSTAARVLRALADLAPSGRREVLDVAESGPLLWHRAILPLARGSSFGSFRDPGYPLYVPPGGDAGFSLPGGEVTRRLVALDRLHAGERVVHHGWGMLAGEIDLDGERVGIRLPLLTEPVELVRNLTRVQPHAGGDRETGASLLDGLDEALVETVFVALREGFATNGDADLDRRLVERFPSARQLRDHVGGLVGRTPELAPPTEGPVPQGPLRLHLGTCTYVARDVESLDVPATLRRWAAQEVDDTAFAALYGLVDEGQEPGAEEERPRPDSPLPLGPAQARAVAAARRGRLTVVSGAPGTGKSHTAVAIALDAVARGESVLLATRSPAAADVLTGLLDRHPGPTPIAFGARERPRIAARLAGGLPDAARGREAEQLHERLLAARQDRDLWLAELEHVYETERLAAGATTLDALVPVLSAAAPGAFDGRLDLRELEREVRRLTAPGGGLIDRFRRRLTERRVRGVLRAPDDVPVGRLVRAVEVARVRRAAAELHATGGVDTEPLWRELTAAEGALREAVGAWLDGTTRGPSDRRERRAVAGLATALRAGRRRRRELLAGLDGGELTDALPLWVGTLRDVEDLLPAQPGLFDLVIVDEASQVDQIVAAPTLLRGRRAVVVGDPHQLRHVSFVPDDAVDEAVASAGVETELRLDVRRDSVFDAAAAVVPVRWLDEHLRSVPHLIEFSAGRFYEGRVTVATRHPAVERADAIDVVRVDASRRSDGPVRGEVEAVLELLEELRREGARDVGVVSPFRVQADALEQAVLDRDDLDLVEDLGLRVGTVHGFQGAESDTVVVSLGLTDDDPANRRRFVESDDLFNVMVTRARRRIVVVTALSDGPPGLVADYLAHAERPPGAVDLVDVADAWTHAVADELRRGGHEVRIGYPVGPWTVDLVLGTGATAVAVLTRTHPDGAAAHIDRRATLDLAGWDVVECFSSRYDGDPVRAALSLGAPR